jgi:ferredoxin-nitrate reductase
MNPSAKTQCPYCGVGCGLEALPPAIPGKTVSRDSNGRPMWQIRGDRTHPSSLGQVCVKGATATEPLMKDRMRYPMVRSSLDEPFRRVSWDEALTLIVRKIQETIGTIGSDGICMYGSGQFQTGDYYIAQKLMKGCLGTNNFDANSRLCMSSAVSGYIQSFGADGPPCCYEDLDETDCAFLIGTNTAECHPILFNRLRKHRKRNGNVKVIVVDPRRTATAEGCDLYLGIQPGTDIDLLNGIAYLLMKWGKTSPDFIQNHTTGFSEYAAVAAQYSPDRVAKRCGIPVADLETAARYWAQSKRVLSMWSMGINQSQEGTAKVRTIINLHLMTGQIGRPGAGPFSLTGQPNAMGGREAGGLSHLLPGYRVVNNPEHRAEVERFWNLPAGQINAQPGRTAWDMITGLEQGEVGVYWVAATNPVVSMPDLDRTKAALLRSPFTIYQDAYSPTEMVAFAHVLLPVAQWSEKTGVMTNSERRITHCPKFRSPPGEARSDWSIFAEVGRRLGFGKQFAFNTSDEVYAEFVRLTQGRPCDQSGLSYEYLINHGPTQWPHPAPSCNLDRRNVRYQKPAVENEAIEAEITQLAKRLYTDLKFHTPDGRAHFVALHSRGLFEPPDDAYPFILTTGRLYGHWHTQSRTGRIPKIQKMHPDPFIEVHPRDAAKLGIQAGDWLEVQSRRGGAKFPVVITKNIVPGTAFIPMHWGALWADHAEANAMTHSAACPDSKQPELKACAVQLVPCNKSALPMLSEERPTLLNKLLAVLSAR